MKPDKTGAPTRIRKSLAAMRVKDQKTGKLKSTDERKGYFYCLKLLGVLPPPPNSGFEQWFYYTPATVYSPIKQNTNQIYYPKCLHDVLIASHSTTCEHRSPYFSYYHRNLMILTELFLNFAHQILRGGFQKLRSVYPSPQFDYIYDNDKQGQKHTLWQQVFKFYKNLKGIPDQIANHYWNPTNYVNDQDLRILEEIAPKQNSDEQIDVLFYYINGAYPWDINVPHRWYNKPQLYNVKDLGTGQKKDSTQTNFFIKDNIPPTKDQIKFVNGELDPRKNKSIYGQNMNFLSDWIDDNSNIVLHRNYQKYSNSEDKRNYAINGISQDEILANYGAKSKNLQYITEAERKFYDLSTNYVENYNESLPHYQYAFAFFNSPISTFFYNPQQPNDGVQKSHNTMHNNYQTIMNDATYSVNSLSFWPYHSGIDLLIQFYIRKANQSEEHEPYESLYHTLNNNYAALPSQLLTIFQTAVGFAQKQLGWNISGGNLSSKLAGAYPICEYISPIIKKNDNEQPKPIPNKPNDLQKLEASFSARDYILTRSNLRDSFQLNEIYQDYYIDQLHPQRFLFLNNIKKFNFNFNYQLGPQSTDTLDQYAKNLPQYLKKMKPQVTRQNIVKNSALEYAANISVASKFIEFSSEKQKVNYVKNETLNVRKLFQSGLHLFVLYASNTDNGSYPISLKYQNILQNLHGEFSQKELLLLQEYISQGHVVGNIQIFGKQEASKACPKCSNDKVITLDLDDNLRRRFDTLWKFIHQQSLNEKLFDSSNPNIKINSIYDMVSLNPNSKFKKAFKDYRFVQGAEEIEVHLTDLTDSKEGKYIRLDAESYSVTKHTINNIFSKKFYTFTEKSFDFYKIFDLFNGNENTSFDSYIYKKLKGVIFVGSKKVEFNINIPNYQRQLRLNVQIGWDGDKLKVVVKDADYNVKGDFYNAAVPYRKKE